MTRFSISFLLLTLLASISLRAEQPEISIIPKPRSVIVEDGLFTFHDRIVAIADEDWQADLWEMLATPLQVAAGISVEIGSTSPTLGFLKFETADTLPSEHYHLQVRPDSVVIRAGDYNGFLYGVQTLLQLLPPQIRSRAKAVPTTKWVLPSIDVDDGPRFPYRGLMLDVSRHFFPMEYIYRVIDEMAFHKLNKFHFHFIDDQGWRLEIKRYPKLTNDGAYRVENLELNWNDQLPPQPTQRPNYGGYYSQEEIKALIAYASKRGIEIIPEVEMPGHVTSAVVAYPYLSCRGQQVLLPNGGTRPPFNDNLCPGKETTYAFIEDVLEETIALFPSQLIHVGGDEVSKVNWKQCPHCQERIKTAGLRDEEELESYFMQRVEKMVAAHGKRMVVWKERSESPKGVIPMIYKNLQGAWEPTLQGYDVIVAPATHTYFDFYQGSAEQEPLAYGHYMPLSQVYRFDPVIDSMSAAQRKHVLGGQANLWAEFVQHEQTSEYMLYPRLAALSEAVWTDKALKDWTDFAKRVQVQFNRYAYAGINYARSAFNVEYAVDTNRTTRELAVTLTTEFPDVEIRYSFDGPVTPNSARYERPLAVRHPTTLYTRTFRDGLPVGKLLVREFGTNDSPYHRPKEK